MTWVTIADVASAVLLLAGALLTLVAAIGLLRFPDLLSRMHSATKPQVLGLLLVLAGLALRLREPSAIPLLALVAVAQMLTAPVASHMVGRKAFRIGLIEPDTLSADELSDTEVHESRGAP
ncbi:MAG TPA: monovalent cation/H(+) antiporter subunit G [Phycicoccus sp.]|nr:monovalent cation/H(+) antiporter subunit G [Phycicoccus sp.]